MSIDPTKTDYLLGLFEHDHCRYQQEINDNNLQHQEPTLSEMMSVALKMLMKEENGFFLLVEGGRIDHAHHSNYARRSLEETREFSRAVKIARSMTDESDTLIVVTADHSHVFTHNGYPWRSENVLGASEVSGTDGLTYSSVSYANGPGYPTTYRDNGNSYTRVDLSSVDMRNPSRRSSATVPLSSETHGAEVS
jgi:alkaline phosphatase